jgi:hypothetical protein
MVTFSQCSQLRETLDLFCDLAAGDCELRVPDVPDLVQKMLEDLYNAVLHHQVRTGFPATIHNYVLSTAQFLYLG